VDAARARLTAGQAAAAQARESHRIIRDRYEGGLADVASLLGAVEAVEHADQTRIEADVALLTAVAGFDRALGKR
jgi:outer membrane protein TolC